MLETLIKIVQDAMAYFTAPDTGLVLGIIGFVFLCAALGCLAIIALFVICMVGLCLFAIGYGIATVMFEISLVDESWLRRLENEAWRNRHNQTCPSLWGELGREFGAWDWKHVNECMNARYVEDVPGYSQRKTRKNRKRKQAQLRNAKPKPMRGIHGEK